jgi:hypothetical protein
VTVSGFAPAGMTEERYIKSLKTAVICKYAEILLGKVSRGYATWFYIKQLTGFDIRPRERCNWRPSISGSSGGQTLPKESPLAKSFRRETEVLEQSHRLE